MLVGANYFHGEQLEYLEYRQYFGSIYSASTRSIWGYCTADTLYSKHPSISGSILGILRHSQYSYCSYSQYSQYSGLRYCSYSQYSQYSGLQYCSYSQYSQYEMCSILRVYSKYEVYWEHLCNTSNTTRTPNISDVCIGAAKILLVLGALYCQSHTGMFVWIVSAMTVTKVVEGCVYIRRRYYGILPRVGGEFEHSALSCLLYTSDAADE